MARLVQGGAPLYHYACYIRHAYGTDRIIVAIKRRSVWFARQEAESRGNRIRGGTAEVVDIVPMKWTEHGFVETRRMRVKTGEFKQRRRAKARKSVRQTKRNK